MMDKLFDGSDAHLLPGNAELIQRLRKHACYTAFPKPVSEAADALEAADKQIAELEQDCKDMGADYQSCGQELYETGCKLDEAHKRIAEERETYDRMLEEGANKLHEAERKLAVAREAMKLASDQARKCDYVPCRSTLLEALAQIGGDE